MKDFDNLLNANIVRIEALFCERMVMLSAICQVIISTWQTNKFRDRK